MLHLDSVISPRLKALVGSQHRPTLLNLLDQVLMIRDNSHSIIKGGFCCVEVNIEGVLITGVIDTGSDITILRDVFYSVVSKSDLNQ